MSRDGAAKTGYLHPAKIKLGIYCFYTAFTMYFLTYIKSKYQEMHYIYEDTLSYHITSYQPTCFHVGIYWFNYF
jgi:hypothetical protein